MRRFAVVFCFVILLTCPQDIKARNIILLTGEYAPYVSAGMDNYGFTAEVVSYAFLSVGIETEFEFTSWENAEKKIATGKYFASFPHKRTIERQKFAYFSDPIAWSKSIFFYMKGKIKTVDFEAIRDLKTYKIAGVKGYYYVPMFKRAELNVSYSSNSEIAFKKLYLEQVDLVPENEFVGWVIIEKLFPDEMWRFGASLKALNEDSLHLMVSKKYPGSKVLLEDFNRGLKNIMKKGIYRSLLKKYIKHADIKMPRSSF